jgi:hypothetical protein
MINFYLSGNKVHDLVIYSFYEGCNEPKTLIQDFKYKPSDVAVIFGFFKKNIPVSIPRGTVFFEQRKSNLDVVVLETGYIHRGDNPDCYYAAGLNGLNGRADFKNRNMPPDRFNLLNINLKPWKNGGEYILVAGQVPWDASVDHVDYINWIDQTINKLKKISNKKIKFRPHPLAKMPVIFNCEYSVDTLEMDLEKSESVVCFNSNIGVDAAIHGIPVFVDDIGSMVYEIANKDINEINNPELKDRRQCFYDLAYTQWNLIEMKNGLAWKHLFNKSS